MSRGAPEADQTETVPKHGKSNGRGVVIPSVTAVTTIRSLGRRGIPTIVVSDVETAPAFYSRYCDESVVVPSAEADLWEFGDALLTLAKRPDVLTIAPHHEVDTYVLSKRRAEFAEHIATPWVSFDTLRTVHDRYQLAAVAESAAVPAPETRLLDEVDDWGPAQVVKPRFSVLTDAYVESLTRDDGVRPRSRLYLEPGVAPDVDAIVEEIGHVPIVQEFVPIENEYGVGAIYDHGEALAFFQHQKHRDHRYTGGASVYRESVRIPILETLTRRLLDHLDWHGIAQVQFMQHAETGTYLLTEINPRFWGSVSCAVSAGADFPYYYWCLAKGHPERIEPGYEVGVATHRLPGELQHLLSIIRNEDGPLVERPSLTRTAWDIVTSTLTQPQFDELSLDDPRPFVQRFLNLGRLP